MTRPLSGDQLELVSDGYRATVATVGATLRRLSHDGRDLVLPFEADELRPNYRGALLAPWPNRVVDGRYRFAGVDHQLALTEPSRGHALHGLVSWLEFEVVETAPDAVTLRTGIPAQAGYPFPLEVSVAYRLDSDGLTTVVSATNVGDAPAPYGTGPHPYLVGGEGRVDGWTLRLPARIVADIVGERLLPGRTRSVGEGDGELDFRVPRPVGTTFIDHAFGGLKPDADGVTTVTVTDRAGSGAGIRWETGLPWVQVHTADLPDEGPAAGRRGLAVEPMTCPPDAFNSAEDLIVLEPGATATRSWTVFAV